MRITPENGLECVAGGDSLHYLHSSLFTLLLARKELSGGGGGYTFTRRVYIYYTPCCHQVRGRHVCMRAAVDVLVGRPGSRRHIRASPHTCMHGYRRHSRSYGAPPAHGATHMHATTACQIGRRLCVTAVQEHCNGGSLRSALQAGAFAQLGIWSRWRGVGAALRGLAEGMAYTHSKRICHGDLNPSNVLLKVRPPPQSQASTAAPSHAMHV